MPINLGSNRVELEEIENVPKFGGNLWFVSKNNGADTNDGASPDTAFETIGAAITAASAGDGITVSAGVYTENVNLNKNNLELWFEIGAILRPATGTALTVSGDYCRVTCREGALFVDPAGANATGVLVTGNFAHLAEIRCKMDGVGDIGYDLQGSGADLRRCRCASPLVAAFKIQGDKVKLENCCTGGDTTSIGFWVTNSCDKAGIKDCGSQGHETAGFQFDVGCTNGVIENCYSSGGDGKFINNATLTDCIISNLHYQGDEGEYNSPIVKLVTFTATGGVDGNGLHYRLFKVTGAVRLVDIGGTITTVLPATATVPNLELTSTNATLDLTDAAGGSDIASAVVGGTLVRIDISTEPLNFSNPNNTPAIGENASKFTDRNVVEVVEDNSADTYITLRLSVALASGAMLWACRYIPLTADGFLEPA